MYSILFNSYPFMLLDKPILLLKNFNNTNLYFSLEGCDFFFWTGDEGIFGVDSTKNKCRFGQYSETKTFLDVKMTMTPLDGAVSGYQGCVID